MFLRLEDLHILSTAATMCLTELAEAEDDVREAVEILTGLVDLPATLAAVAAKLTEVRGQAEAARAAGAKGGVLPLTFGPAEWRVTFYAICRYHQVYLLVERLVPAEKTALRREAIDRVRLAVDEMIHHPDMPGRCTCRDQTPEAPEAPGDHHRWN